MGDFDWFFYWVFPISMLIFLVWVWVQLKAIEKRLFKDKRFVWNVFYHGYLQSVDWKDRSFACKWRDEQICQICKKDFKGRSNELVAHHTDNYKTAFRPLLSHDTKWIIENDIEVQNCITLCRDCHSKEHPPGKEDSAWLSLFKEHLNDEWEEYRKKGKLKKS